jgi:hypothetical protein
MYCSVLNIEVSINEWILLTILFRYRRYNCDTVLHQLSIHVLAIFFKQKNDTLMAILFCHSL